MRRRLPYKNPRGTLTESSRFKKRRRFPGKNLRRRLTKFYKIPVEDEAS